MSLLNLPACSLPAYPLPSDPRFKNLTGQKYGSVTVVSFAFRKNGDRTKWNCVCDCGKEFIVCGEQLKSGNTKTCGCGHHSSKDNVGKRVGRLFIVSVIPTTNQHSRYLCRCDCGNEKEFWHSAIFQANVDSCGCRTSEKCSIRSTKHGMSSSSVYKVWAGMKDRCLNKKNKFYCHYGERGIKVCTRWLVFENFIADMGPRKRGLTIERINNEGDYEPSNCRWVTRKVQQRNRRCSINLTVGGRTACISQWADERCMNRNTIVGRLKAGWTHEKAVMTPVQAKFTNGMARKNG